MAVALDAGRCLILRERIIFEQTKQLAKNARLPNESRGVKELKTQGRGKQFRIGLWSRRQHEPENLFRHRFAADFFGRVIAREDAQASISVVGERAEFGSHGFQKEHAPLSLSNCIPFRRSVSDVIAAPLISIEIKLVESY